MCAEMQVDSCEVSCTNKTWYVSANCNKTLETEETLFYLRQKQGNFSPPKCPVRFVAQSASYSLSTESCLPGGSGELERFVWQSYQLPFSEKI